MNQFLGNLAPLSFSLLSLFLLSPPFQAEFCLNTKAHHVYSVAWASKTQQGKALLSHSWEVGGAVFA